MGSQLRAEPGGVESERRGDALVEGVEGIEWEADPDSFQFSFVSEPAERILGYPVQAWREPGFWAGHLHPDDREGAVALCTSATREGRNHDLEYRLIAADGRAVWLRDLVTVVIEGGRPVKLRGVMFDVSRAKEAEAALRESEQLHRLLTESAHDLVTLFDADGRCVYASPSYRRAIGAPPAERGDRVHPDDVGAIHAAWQRCLAGGEPTVTFRLRDAGGEWRWLEARSALVRHHDRPHVVFVARDVTDTRRADEERRGHLWFYESLDRVNRAIQGTHDLEPMMEEVLAAVLEIFDCDRAWVLYPCDPDAPTWRVTMERTRPAYPGLLAHVGLREVPMDDTVAAAMRAALSSSSPVRYGPGEPHPIPPELAESFAIQAMLVVTLRPKRDRAYLFGLHQCSRPRRFTASEERLFQEIGRRLDDALTSMVVLRDLRASQGKLAEAERIAGVGYWELSLDGGPLAWSEEAYRILGIPPGEAKVLADLEALIHPDDRPAWSRALGTAIAGGARYEHEYRLVRPDGETRVVHSQGDLRRDQTGRARAMFGTVQDVTERRRAEESLRLFRSLLDHAHDAIEVVDPESGRFLDVNVTACRQLGYTPEEYRRLTVADVDLAPLERPWREWTDELRRAGAIVVETRRRRKDGSTFAVEVNATYARLDRDYIIGVVRDIEERKRAEDALRASERELRATFELSAVGQAQADPATGRLVRVNRKLCESLGYSREELIELDFASLTHPDDRARDLAEFGRMVRGEIPEYGIEKRLIRKDGEVVWFHISASVIFDTAGNPLRTVAIGTDITARRRAAEALAASEARFRTFVDHATDAFFLHDAGGTIIDVNQQACASLGYTREELIGMSPTQIDDGVDVELMRGLGRRLDSGEIITLETWHRRKDGTRFPVELRMRPFWHDGRRYGMSLVRDITERLRSQRDLVESNAVLRAVIEGTSDAVFVKDAAGRYELINSAGARLVGRSVEEVLGKDDTAFFPPEIAAALMAHDRAVMLSEVPYIGEEVARALGVSRTFLTSKSVRRDAQGRVTGVIGIARDVTELKRLEEQFRQAQKMEAVGRLAGGVAHDFNNLLTVINANSAFLLAGLPVEDSRRELLVDVQAAGRRAANLTRQLLAFSRKQVLEPQVVNINAVLADLLKLLSRLIGEDIEIDLAPAADLGQARIDPGQFEQAIINLAVNARDAMPGGGRLTIATQNVALDAAEAARHPDVAPGRYVRVAVSDTGHGMDPATRARIFEPFFTTKPQGKGTGLGLAMVYGFVKQSGGHVDVDSAPAAGTTFVLYLPRADVATTQPAAPAELAAVAGGKETVLVVEDDAAVRRLVVRVLRAAGYQVLDAEDGREALARVAAHPGRIDLVVTDLIMPGIGGRELAGRLARERPDTRVLFMSGYSDEAVARGGDDAGAGFIHKPFTAEALAEKVRKILDA